LGDGGGSPSCTDITGFSPCASAEDTVACTDACVALNLLYRFGTCYLDADGSMNCRCCYFL
jgi:hypothetical protein